jgi:ankyrin repeat protein
MQLGKVKASFTPLHRLAVLAAPSDIFKPCKPAHPTKQLIEHGANVNAVSSDGATPLYMACHTDLVTNLDFV